jgi:hypothetical protein
MTPEADYTLKKNGGQQRRRGYAWIAACMSSVLVMSAE